MIAELGHISLTAALALALVLIISGILSAYRDEGDWLVLSKRASIACFAFTGLAFALLIVAFLQSDFSVQNVFENSHSEKPLGYKITGAWGSHEGSMVMWCLGLTGYLGAFAWLGRTALLGRALAVGGGVIVLFLAFTIFASNPFDRLDPAPLDGRGLNPLLQDPALAAHPPMLYLGLTGLIIPFVIAVAALWANAPFQEWARQARNWTLAAFASLTLGITLGSYWAYYELGWGGWWFWDPVENASLMPWLLAAALFHSLAMTAGRSAMAAWSLFLSLSAFSLAILGLFLTRSGVLLSVHAFALDPERGLLLLGILGIVAGVGFTLFAWRSARLFQEAVKFDPVSREGALILNNALITLSAAIVLVGTLFPLIIRSASGETVAVGPPYFELTIGPVMAIAFLILPLAPFMRWRRGDLTGPLKRLTYGGVAALASLAALLVFFWGAPIGAMIAASLGVWIVAGAIADARAYQAQHGATGRIMAHLGVGLFLLGAAADSGFSIERTTALVPGQSFEVAGRTVTLEGLRRADDANFLSDQAIIRVDDGDRSYTLTPERRLFPIADQTTTEVSIRRSVLGDFYVSLGEARQRENGDTAWVVRAATHPFIWLIFLGATMTAIGAGVSAGSTLRSRQKARVEAPA